MAKTILTQARLQELLHYDPDTGIFTWLETRKCNSYFGKVAGGMVSGGYLAIRIDHVRYRAHRLAWLYMHGAWPTDQIDHRDGIKTNNAWNNLREATGFQNMQNRTKALGNSSSGLRGASWDKSDGVWKAFITVNRKTTHLGSFKTAEEAHEAYVMAKRKLHPFWDEENNL